MNIHWKNVGRLAVCALTIAAAGWAQNETAREKERNEKKGPPARGQNAAPAQRSTPPPPAPPPAPAPQAAPRPSQPAYTPAPARQSEPAYTPAPRPSQQVYTPAPAANPAPAPAPAPARTPGGNNTFGPRGGAPAGAPGVGSNAGPGGGPSRGPQGQGRTTYTPPPQTAVTSRTPTGAAVLNQDGSRNVVQQVNGSRAGMQGINGRPIPQGNVTVHPNGNLTVATASGGAYNVRGNGTVASISSQGRAVNFRPDGRVAAIHTQTMDIQRGVHGEQVIRTVRPDHAVLVSTGPRNGYLERSVVVRNQTIIQRTYVMNGVVSTRAFVNYPFRGGFMPMYVPRVYFAPAFYGWAFYPWSTPVVFSWGWGRDPWVGYYAGYYQPYAAYPGPNAWLTDYYLSQMLAAEYAAQNQAPALPGYGAPGYGAPPQGYPQQGYGDPQAQGGQYGGELYAQQDTPITPALRDAIAAEVSRQLAYENAIASGTAQPTVEQLPNALQAGRVFVVSANLQVTTADGQMCDLTPADVLQLNDAPPPDSPTAILTVASGKRQDCPAGVNVAVQLQDLAEMQNNMRAQMDAGLETLHASQGQNGLPAAPAAAMAGATRPALDVPLPPDPNVPQLLDAQQGDAQSAELATVQSVAAAQ